MLSRQQEQCLPVNDARSPLHSGSSLTPVSVYTANVIITIKPSVYMTFIRYGRGFQTFFFLNKKNDL